MLAAGYYYTLKTLRTDQRGAWLNADGEELFLPRRECPPHLQPGLQVRVFIYLDRGRRRMATTRKPLAQVGEFALLRVTDVGPHGAFLDWGLSKELLAPYAEQAEKMAPGRSYIVRICHDREQRPIASGRLEKFLQQADRDLAEGQEVQLLIWAFTPLGVKVIINNRYQGLLYKESLSSPVKRGDRCQGFISGIRDDGRIDVSLHPAGAAGVDAARGIILSALRAEGFLPLHDQSPPEAVRSHLGLSKKLFKKAVGGLYKDGLIQLVQDGIRLI